VTGKPWNTFRPGSGFRSRNEVNIETSEKRKLAPELDMRVVTNHVIQLLVEQIYTYSGSGFLFRAKKREATKSVAPLENQRRSNVSEWSNHNIYR